MMCVICIYNHLYTFEHGYMYMCVHACGDQHSTSVVIFNHCPLSFFR